MENEKMIKLLPIIQNYSEGKPIEFRKNITDKWKDVTSNWDFEKNADYEYRIKPIVNVFTNDDEKDPALCKFKFVDIKDGKIIKRKCPCDCNCDLTPKTDGQEIEK